LKLAIDLYVFLDIETYKTCLALELCIQFPCQLVDSFSVETSYHYQWTIAWKIKLTAAS